MAGWAWRPPLPNKQRSRAAEKSLIAAMLMWATSKFLMDGSRTTDERARVCHESRAPSGEHRGQLSHTVFTWCMKIAECHLMSPMGSPRAPSSQSLLQCDTFLYLPSIIQPFIKSFYGPSFVPQLRVTKVKKTHRINKSMAVSFKQVTLQWEEVKKKTNIVHLLECND